MKYLMIFVCFLMSIVAYSQDLTALYKSKNDVFKTVKGAPASQFEIEANDEQIQFMENYTSPLFDHLKFVHLKLADNRYDVIMYFRPTKDFEYLKTTLLNLGIVNVSIGDEVIAIEELAE